MTEAVCALRTRAVAAIRRLWRQPRRYYRAAEPVALVEPPIEFIAAPKMPEAELEALRQRPHP